MTALGRGAFFGLLLAIQPLEVNAQEPVCAPRAEMDAALSGDRWRETVIFRALTPSQVAEVWLNPVTGTWTWVVTDYYGESCVAAAGKDGELLTSAQAISSTWWSE